MGKIMTKNNRNHLRQLAALALFGLSACTKDDLSQIDIKTDGSFKSSYSVGSGGSGAYGRMRTGLSF